ncbi:MAG: glycosyltransferase [Planctomycetes bacterium]|nr:glycosyltransferase [Planctomycetota bacterium]
MAICSVILSTFNQPNALRLCLTGYKNQSYKDFELIIADDGSDEETKAVIEEFKPRFASPIKHVWQENHGYRRAKIVNEGFKISEGKVVILTDGDTIPNKNFVKIHAENCRENAFCVGGFIMLSADYCRALTMELVEKEDYEKFLTAGKRFRFAVKHWKNLFYIARGKMDRPKVFGCNISVWRSSFEAVNGYDENFDGFGKEDSDLRNRLRKAGVRPVSLWGKTYVFHVDSIIDPKIMQSRIPRDKNKAREYYYRPDVPARCVNGIKKS